MKRKALSFLLVLCLIIGMVPVAALADSDPVVEVNGQQFSDLETAMSQIQTICDAGKTASVKLLGDASWNTEQSLSIPEGYTVTLDLAGHALSGSTTGPLLVNYGNLTIEDSTAGEDSHKIMAPSQSMVVFSAIITPLPLTRTIKRREAMPCATLVPL